VVAELSGATERDLVFFVISGGGSALLPVPAAGLSLADKIATTDLLLRSGAPIQDVNCVRKHLSAVKGGRLAVIASPATVVGLALSDVLGDPLHAIASGPLSPDPTTLRDAVSVVRRYRLPPDLLGRVLSFLTNAEDDPSRETPKLGDPVFERVHLTVVGSNALAAAAAAEQAEALGYETMVLTTYLEGEAREAGRFLASIAREIVQRNRPVRRPACVIAGGETTVTVRGEGRGGRNQELALAAGLFLADAPGATIVSFATDGTDGPTDAAGGVADSTTAARATALGIDLYAALGANDSSSALDRLNDIIRTKPTGTNVNDLVVTLIQAHNAEAS
jgi:hydroxypyruvate reductase